jgi:hypothetical protein
MSFHIKEIGWIKWVGSISRRYTAFSCHQGCRTMSQQDRLLALASGTARLKTFRFRWEIIVESFKKLVSTKQASRKGSSSFASSVWSKGAMLGGN